MQLNNEISHLTKQQVLDGLLFMKYKLPQIEHERIQREKKWWDEQLIKQFPIEIWKRFDNG